ncbi:hypothetical protein CPB86DRAFT_724023 [Serendipita vermifera]|nr:hypothetical protein CPB86DRAFT_724023 [Serendipita vermifera]
MPTATLEGIPADVLLSILEFLDLQSICSLAQTSRSLNSMFSLHSTWMVIARVLCKVIPVPDPAILGANSSVQSLKELKERIIRCKRFHDAWAGSSPTVATHTLRKIPIPEKICLVRILPGGSFIVVVDLSERALFYNLATGRLVGSQSFSLISPREVIYSIDFTTIDPKTVAWGLLTSEHDGTQEEDMSRCRLCVRVILITLHKNANSAHTLSFQQVLEQTFTGSAEMLSISGDIVAKYTYRYRLSRTPEIWIWNWRHQTVAHHALPSVCREEGGEVAIGHPSLHTSPSGIFLLGGQLGFHSLYAQSDNASFIDFSSIKHVGSTPEDMSRLQYSSQGRCSKAWWGVEGRPWHRLVSSPAPHDEENPLRPLVVWSFEVSNGPNDVEARRHLLDLGKHHIVQGFETSPQLYHISRYGTKAFWLSFDEENQINTVQSAALPNFTNQQEKGDKIPIKQILLDPSVDTRSLRAFDVDETAPFMAFAEEEMLWIVEPIRTDM